jgi:anti-anti-sigma factor
MLEVEIDERYVSPVVVRLKGTISAAGGGNQVLRGIIEELLSNDKAKILLDIGKITFVDQSGRDELVFSYRRAQDNGGRVKLLNIPKPVFGEFHARGFVTLFEIHDNEDKAVKSFQ